MLFIYSTSSDISPTASFLLSIANVWWTVIAVSIFMIFFIQMLLPFWIISSFLNFMSYFVMWALVFLLVLSFFADAFIASAGEQAMALILTFFISLIIIWPLFLISSLLQDMMDTPSKESIIRMSKETNKVNPC